MNYLASLNEKQLEAVRETEGYLRVIAGAGSGKTKLLVSRYAYLVKEYGINSANILCVTFTNKAAGEMRRRIRKLIGEEYDTSLICTYHGFCVRVLREDIEKIFYPKEFQIIDTAQQKSILGEIYQKFELKLDHASFEKIIKEIGIKKSNRKYVSKMCLRDKCQITENISSLDDRIAEEYMQRQKQIYAMDFDDLMYFTLDIFSRYPEILAKWQDRLNYIQVDEFQDSSSTEMELIDLLCGKHKNLMIVGDPDQNIYEWRGSDVKLLVEFDKNHIPTKTVFLNQNYRSTSKILKCANTLIEKNIFRLKKDLFTKQEGGADVFHYHSKNEFEEAEQICTLISERKKENKSSFSEFAILYRSGFISRIIEKKFTENGIPYEIYGGVKFYQRMEIQDIMAYLRLIAFDDDISFKRIVNTPRRRFGRTKFKYLNMICEDKRLYQTLKENIDDPVFKSSEAKKFINMIESLRQEYGHMTISDIVERVCSDSGYEKYIRELGDMERFENLAEFKRIAGEYEKNFGESVSLSEFINQISLQAQDNGEENADTVKLMTIHAAKGLEFPYVFIVGFSEGIFPSSKTIEERKEFGLEEERRLCYVALTRAEKELFLLDSEGYNQNGRQKLPSRFLYEIGEENYLRIGNIPNELTEASKSFSSDICNTLPERKIFSVGDTITHPAFGNGKILGYGKNKNSYIIKFDKLSSERDISLSFFEQRKDNKNSFMHPCKTQEPKEPEISPVSETPVESQVTPNPDIAPKPSLKASIPCKSTESATIKKPDLKDYDNLWDRDDVPKSGWICAGISDLGEPAGVCEMCGHQIIRYVHHMMHPEYRSLGVGCICAGKMEGDTEGAVKREQNFKNKEKRRANFIRRQWKTSKGNNSYLKIKNHIIVLYYNKEYNHWKYSIDNVFCSKSYKTKNEAASSAFDAFERIK